MVFPGLIPLCSAARKNYAEAEPTRPAAAGACIEQILFSLTFSQIFEFVKRSSVAGRLGSGLPGRMLSRLTPTDVGTLRAFLTGREKCGVRIKILRNL